MKILGVKTYIYSITFITILALIISLLRLHTTINLVRLSLLLFMFSAIGFIIVNISNVRFNYHSTILVILTIVSLVRGVLFSDFSERIILDTYKPLSFVMIYMLFSKIDFSLYEEKLLDIFNTVVKTFYKTSIFFVLLSSFLLFYFGGYPGIRIPAILPSAFFAVMGRKTRFFVLVLAILFSGKRAVLLTILPMVKVLYRIKFTVKKMTIAGVILLISYLIINANWETMRETKGVSKFVFTVEQLQKFNETGSLEILNYASGRRLEEITSSLHGFTVFDYMFGAGVGYTYDRYDINRETIQEKDYGNVHFSPISLVISYGLFFMIILYWLLIRCCSLGFKYARKHNDKFLLMLSLILLAFIIESFFAYVLFVLPFIPIVLGLIHGKINYFNNSNLRAT